MIPQNTLDHVVADMLCTGPMSGIIIRAPVILHNYISHKFDKAYAEAKGNPAAQQILNDLLIDLTRRDDT